LGLGRVIRDLLLQEGHFLFVNTFDNIPKMPVPVIINEPRNPRGKFMNKLKRARIRPNGINKMLIIKLCFFLFTIL